MANEITHNTRVQLTNGSLKFDFNPGRIQINQTTALCFDRTCVIATGETTVAITGATTPRLCIIYNHDPTNYVTCGFVATATTSHPLRLYPASFPTICELNTTLTTLYLTANTASCKVRIIVFEL